MFECMCVHMHVFVWCMYIGVRMSAPKCADVFVGWDGLLCHRACARVPTMVVRPCLHTCVRMLM